MWALARDVTEELHCFPVLSFVTAGHRIIGRPTNGSR